MPQALRRSWHDSDHLRPDDSFGTVSAVGLITTPAIIGFGSNFNPFTHSFDLKANIARAGLNYRF